MSHTPGPWSPDIERREVTNPGAVLRDLRIIAEIHADDAEGSNTRLIAAAPELLKALQDIEMETRSGGQWTPAEINEVARAAIAKAEGK